jgi:hypothetical protein
VLPPKTRTEALFFLSVPVGLKNASLQNHLKRCPCLVVYNVVLVSSCMEYPRGPRAHWKGFLKLSLVSSATRGGGLVPEWGPLGSMPGALSNERVYYDLRNPCASPPAIPINAPSLRRERVSEYRRDSMLHCEIDDPRLRG